MEFLQRGVAACCDNLENVDGQLLIIWVSKKSSYFWPRGIQKNLEAMTQHKL